MWHTLTTCFWKDIESDICAQTLTRTHTWLNTHAHMHLNDMCTCTQIHASVMYTHALMYTHTHTTSTHWHTYTNWVCAHTHTHNTACKLDNFEKSLIFSHTASILVSVAYSKEEKAGFDWLSGGATVGKMMLNSLPCYFQKSFITCRWLVFHHITFTIDWH